MRSVLLPGKPNAVLEAISVGIWARKRLIAYISGSSLTVLSDFDVLLQTIYVDSPAPFNAVSIDSKSGRIAVGASGSVWIYSHHASNDNEAFVKWSLECEISLSEEDAGVTSLDWGLPDELLVGSASLSLWSLSSLNHNPGDPPKMLWRRTLPNPVRSAKFSCDAGLIASVGETDRLVKVWRRLAVGEDTAAFDFGYLPHPRAVASIQWRVPPHEDMSVENVLYTIARDGLLRVWAPNGGAEGHVLQEWSTIDIGQSIPEGMAKGYMRLTAILDGKALTQATERAVALAGNEMSGSIVRLAEAANRTSEVVMVYDRSGTMSAWGLEHVGCKSRKPSSSDVFNVVQADLSGLGVFLEDVADDETVVTRVFESGSGLVMLLHSWDGRIAWFEGKVEEILESTPTEVRWIQRGVWSGHETAVQSCVRTANGKVLVTSTAENEHLLWEQFLDDRVKLRRRSAMKPPTEVKRVVILNSGKYIMTLHQDHVALWDATRSVAAEVERCNFNVDGSKILCLFLLPEPESPDIKRFHVVAITSSMFGIVWEIRLPALKPKDVNGANCSKEANGVNGSGQYMCEFAKFDLGASDDLLMVIPVDPVGWNATLGEHLDMFSREVATSISNSGILRSWTAKIYQEESKLKFLETSTVTTGLSNPSLAKGNSIRKIALVDSERSELTIWDSRAGQLEFRQKNDQSDTIRDLDWTSTPQSQSILAVGFPHRVVLMCQLRYDYLHAGPAWAAFREINIRDMTPHPIGDSIWLSDGGLVIGAGNQLLVYQKKIDKVDDTLKSLHLSSHKAKHDDVFEIVNELNGPLPVYHPQFLQQCILSAKSKLVETILVSLHKELRNYHEEIGLDPFLGLGVNEVFTTGDSISSPSLTRRPSRYTSFFEAIDEDSEVFDEELCHSLCELLTKVPVPHITGKDQIKLANIVECVGEVHKHRRSIDENGERYLLFFRQYAMRKAQPTSSNGLSFREIAWAFHSDSQEILVDLVNRNVQGRMLWHHARESGIFMWLRDTEAMKRQFEIVARNHYTATDEKNPVDCSLHYLALKKKNVLMGLWRMAGWNREQSATMKFLANDFKQPRWRTAAKKNAFALLGKHRFEYAAAFFLLADAPKDAINVCFSNLHDHQLAITIARLYDDTPNGPLFNNLLETHIVPFAVSTGDRWLATWTFWQLNRKDESVRALLSPLDSLLPSSSPSAPPSTRLFLLDDPALIILYAQIREKTLSALRGAEKIPPEMEFGFVLHTARLLDRMGCDLLALDLVRGWSFLKTEREKPLIERRSMERMEAKRGLGLHRRRSSVMLDEAPKVVVQDGDGEVVKELKGLVKPPQSVFEEPSMDWAFG